VNAIETQKGSSGRGETFSVTPEWVPACGVIKSRRSVDSNVALAFDSTGKMLRKPPGRFFERCDHSRDANIMKSATIIAICAGLVRISLGAQIDTTRIDEITGLKGKLNEKEGVYRITFPRADIPVTIDNWKMPPFMGLGTWAAFEGTNEQALMMGDTVLFEDEVNPVMSVAFENGLSVTALHNHFFYDQPKVFFMHLEGRDTIDKLAGAVRKVYDKIKEIRSANPKPKTAFGDRSLGDKNSITAEPLNEIFGLHGDAKDGMVKFSIGHKAKMHEFNIDNDMGSNTWAAFAGTDDNAIVDGDFAVEEDQLQSALKSLRRNGINIVAIHSHMTHEQPRILFFHYWGRGAAKDLARTIKDALTIAGILEGTSQARR